MLNVDVVINIPTSHNADLFRALSELVDLRVHFEAPANSLRSWVDTDKFLDGYDGHIHRGARVGRFGFWAPALARSLRPNADVLLLGGSYTSPTIVHLLLRGPKGPTRIFWGERFMTTRVANSMIRKRLLTRADSLLAVGETAARQYRAVTRAPVHVFPYSCAFSPGLRSPSLNQIGFVGQLIDRKGLELLFQACSLTGIPSVGVVGSGAMEGSFRRDASARGLSVTWHGECPNSSIRRIRSAWAFQVVPSRYDGWGVVVNEALASGTPVVVSSTTGAVELIREGVNGWTCLANDVPSLTEALRQAQEHSFDTDVLHATALSGHAFSAESAASFLVDVVTRPGGERSFIGEQWHKVEERLRRWPDPDHRIPHSVCRDDPPPP